MKKSDELADQASCWNHAGPETNVFVLLDWDAATAATIRHWAFERIKLGLNRPGDDQIVKARALADEIEQRLPEVKRARATQTRLNPAAAWPFPTGRT